MHKREDERRTASTVYERMRLYTNVSGADDLAAGSEPQKPALFLLDYCQKLTENRPKTAGETSCSDDFFLFSGGI